MKKQQGKVESKVENYDDDDNNNSSARTRKRGASKLILQILGIAAAGALIAAWVFFDGPFLFNVPPRKDKKFKDKRIRLIDWSTKKNDVKT